MPAAAREEEVPRIPMEMGSKDEGVSQLVPALQEVPPLHNLRRAESNGGFLSSFCGMYTVQCQEDLLSMRRASRARKVWRQSVASFWREIPELDIALYSVPHLHHVRC